jgi:hypothetical protein
MSWFGALRVRLRAAPLPTALPLPRDPERLFSGLGAALTLLVLSGSCVAHRALIEEAWQDAVRRSGVPRDDIRRPEVIEPPRGFKTGALPRDDDNRPVVAQYFPLTHQVRIYARIAFPMRRALVREFLYAIYYDRLAARPIDLTALAATEPAQSWVEQALERQSGKGP